MNGPQFYCLPSMDLDFFPMRMFSVLFLRIVVFGVEFPETVRQDWRLAHVRTDGSLTQGLFSVFARDCQQQGLWRPRSLRGVQECIDKLELELEDHDAWQLCNCGGHWVGSKACIARLEDYGVGSAFCSLGHVF